MGGAGHLVQAAGLRPGPTGGLFNVSEQAQRIAGQRLAFFRGGDFDTAEIAVAVFTERLHIEAVIVAQIPLVLLSKKDQRATNLGIRQILVTAVVLQEDKYRR